MRGNAQKAHLEENYKAHLINLRLQSNFGVKILTKFQTNRLKALRKAFESWKLRNEAAKMIERIQSTIKAELALKEGQNQKLVKALQAKQADLQGELAKQKELHQ